LQTIETLEKYSTYLSLRAKNLKEVAKIEGLEDETKDETY
jgi:hypothetical protein